MARLVFHLRKETTHIVAYKGGAGSGHHGHQGRPGKRGGSLPGVSGLFINPDEVDYWLSDSKINRIVYTRVSKDVANSIAEHGLDFSKASYRTWQTSGLYALDGDPPKSYGEVKLAVAVKSKNPFVGSVEEVEKKVSELRSSITPPKITLPDGTELDVRAWRNPGQELEALRHAWLDQGYDAIIQRQLGEADVIIAIDPSTVKIVGDVNAYKGGAGSGHHGHAGRPGKRGGSLPGSSWKDGPVSYISDIGSGKSVTKVALMVDGTEVIYKEQNKNLQYHRGTSAYGEEAAYIVAKDYLLYDELVPKTVALDNDRSVQQLLTEGSIGLDVYDTYIDEASFKQLVVLDMVTGNADRHLGNVWVMPNGKVKGIDNDHSFISKITYGVNIRTDTVRDALYRSSDAYYLLTGKKLEMTAKDFVVARRLQHDVNFKQYIISVFGEESWNLTNSRLSDMRGIYADLKRIQQ
jgi:hypothetical protein